MSTLLYGSATESFEDKFVGLTPLSFLHWAADEFGEGLAVSTSFGIQSAVTLHLVKSVAPDIRVIWVDTGYLPGATHQYAQTLTERLDLNVHKYASALSPLEMERIYGRLWESNRREDLDLYDHIRKVEPMQRALRELGVRGWVSGLRSAQTEFRKTLRPLKRTGNMYRIYPILDWSDRDVLDYMRENNLPEHPLFRQGYATVGDQHSSRPLNESDTSERQTRFRGLKQECGLHKF